MGSDWYRMTLLIRSRKRSSAALAMALIASSAPLLINFSQPTYMDASTTARISQKLTGRKLQESRCFIFNQMVQNGNFGEDGGSLSECYNQGSGTKKLIGEDGCHNIDIADRHEDYSFGGNIFDNHTEG